MTVVRKRDSHEGDVKCIKIVCQLMEGYDGYGGSRCKGLWEGMTVLSRCDSPQEV